MLLFGLVLGAVVSSVIAIRRTRIRPSSGSTSADGLVRLRTFFRSPIRVQSPAGGDSDVPMSPEASRRADSQGSRPSERLVRLAALGCLPLLVVGAIAVSLLGVWLVWTAQQYSTVTPNHDALIGTWRGDNGTTVVFTPDGRFSGQVGGDPSARPEGGSWYIGKEPLGDSTGVVLTFNAGYTFELLARGRRSSPTLFYYIGDIDENRRYEFKKL
jgi:hypothetical protein